MKKVVDIPDLGGRVPFEGHPGICFSHAFPVVGDLDQCLAGFLNEEADIGGTGVDGVLQQFFHGAGRSLDHLPCCDLVGDVIGQ